MIFMTGQSPETFGVGISVSPGFEAGSLLSEVEAAGIHAASIVGEVAILGKATDEEALSRAAEIEGVESVEDLRELKRSLA